jgi:sugar/nucleoside kinase (ribokinase family)
MSKKYDVIVAGSYCLDLIFTGLPGHMELGKEIISSGFSMLPGEAFTASATMHRLGLKVGWAADFGCDDFSRFVLDKVQIEGLDESLFVHHDRPLRRITAAASYPHERAFLSYFDPDPKTPAILKALAKASGRALFLTGLYYGPLFDAGLLLLKTKRMRLFMDGNSEDKDTLENAAVRKAISSADVFLPNSQEARSITGSQDIQEALHTLGNLCHLVVIKDGPNGAWAIQDDEVIHEPAIPVKVLDTTGAGDSFSAGFMKAWLDDRPLRECLRWGNIIGGLSTTAHGGSGRVITLAEVQDWLSRLEKE